jgi:hypothetical protein
MALAGGRGRHACCAIEITGGGSHRSDAIRVVPLYRASARPSAEHGHHKLAYRLPEAAGLNELAA